MSKLEEGSFGPTPINEAEPTIDGTETERAVRVPLPGNRVVAVTYDLGEITPRLRKSISAMAESDEDKAEQAMISLLERIVVSWDYKTRKDKVVEPVADAIAENISLRDLSAIVSAIFQGATSPNAAEGAN